MTLRVLLVVGSIFVTACATKPLTPVVIPSPPAAHEQELEELASRVQKIEQAPAMRLATARLASASQIYLGQPIVMEWDAAPACVTCVPPTVAPLGYETTVDGTGYVDVGNVLTWTMPAQTIGSHIAGLRSYNKHAVTGDKQYNDGGDSTVSFVVVNPNPLPTKPGVPRIVSPTKVLSQQEQRELADSYAYVLRLVNLSGSELNQLIAGYKGPLPPTYGSVLAYLEAVTASMK